MEAKEYNIKDINGLKTIVKEGLYWGFATESEMIETPHGFDLFSDMVDFIISENKQKRDAFDDLDVVDKDKEEHHVFDKKDRKIISAHQTRGAAYRELFKAHNFNPDLTVLHNKDQLYR